MSGASTTPTTSDSSDGKRIINPNVRGLSAYRRVMQVQFGRQTVNLTEVFLLAGGIERATDCGSQTPSVTHVEIVMAAPNWFGQTLSIGVLIKSFD